MSTSRWRPIGVVAVVAGAATLAGPWAAPRAAEADAGRDLDEAPSAQRLTAPPPAKPPPPKPARAACPADMASIPGGTYTVSLPIMDGWRTFTVAPFCLDKTEVTAQAYAACVASSACTATHVGDESTDDGTTFKANAACNYKASGRENHPMNCVTWGQSTTYCAAKGKRLPATEEWVWAAQGAAVGSTYPWGKDAPKAQLCWSGLTKRSGTCAVALFPAGNSPQGVSDLAGGVGERTTTLRKSKDGSMLGATFGDSYEADKDYQVNSDSHSLALSEDRYPTVGFRCARTP